MAPKSRFSRSGPPLEPSKARTLSLETPPEGPRACFGAPRPTPNPPKSAQEPSRTLSNSHKVGMLKTREISLFGTQESKKNAPGRFFDAPSDPQGPSGTATLILKGAPGPPERVLGAPRPPPGSSQSPPRPPLGNSIRQALNRKSTIFRFYTFFQPFLTLFIYANYFAKSP